MYQRRAFAVSELRVEQRHRGVPPTVVGHAAVFDSLSDDLGGFRERIAPGAFTRTLREGGPVYALWNHNPDFIVASTVNATLRLSEDKRGLLAEMDPMDTPTIRDLVVKPIQDGVVNRMSFGFSTVKDEMDKDSKDPVRILRDVDLFDVSPVTFPAYPQTDIQARAIVSRIERGLPLTSEDADLLTAVIEMLSRSLTKIQEEKRQVPPVAGAIESEMRARRLRLYQLAMKGLN